MRALICKMGEEPGILSLEALELKPGVRCGPLGGGGVGRSDGRPGAQAPSRPSAFVIRPSSYTQTVLYCFSKRSLCTSVCRALGQGGHQTHQDDNCTLTPPPPAAALGIPVKTE